MEGWIKIHRKILDNPIICKDSDYLSVWIYLLLNATHKEIPAVFKKEKITDLKKIESVCLDFANSIGNIIDVISNDNILLGDYLEDTFGIAEKQN